MTTAITIFRYLTALATGGLLLQGCQSSLDRIEEWDTTDSSEVPTDIRLATAPDGFDFATTAEADFFISARHSFSEAGLANVGLSLWANSPADTLVQVAQGITDVNGNWRARLSLDTDIDSVRLRVNNPGYPQEHNLVVKRAGTTQYTLGKDNAQGRVVEDVTVEDADLDAPLDGEGAAELGGRAPFAYMGTFDRQGVPDYLTAPGTIWPDVLDFIAVNLPESSIYDHHPEYLDPRFSSSVRFREAGELWLSFAHEGAGYRNSVGYFFYPLDEEPTKVNQIDIRTVAFPNVSYAGSGGGLKVADRVYIGEVPANTGVGFFLVPNGWDSRNQRVNDKNLTRYTIDALNTFTKSDYRKHAVLLANNPRQFMVLGFEDLRRPAGDNDFNDAVFIVQPEPWSAVDVSQLPVAEIVGSDQDGDGVADFRDAYPDDAQRAFNTYAPAENLYGTLAYEDMWPRTGDFDFNDLVVDYNITEVLAPDNRIKDLRIKLRLRALGATQNHGFAIQLPIPTALVEQVTGQLLAGNEYITLAGNGTEANQPNAVIPAFANSWQLLGTRQGIVNTDPGKPGQIAVEQEVIVTFTQPIKRELLGRPPYDAFMIRSQDRGIEIHMAGYAPTPLADASLFNTQADKSDAATGAWYVDKNNLPWAVHLPQEFKYPKERTRIDQVYTNFIEWAVYGGQTEQGWWNPDDGNFDDTNAY